MLDTNPISILEGIGAYPDTYAVKNTKVSDADLRAITEASDLQITEVRAPLSKISFPILGDFLKVHGRNLTRFNLQNCPLSEENLSRLSPLLPNVRVLSMQYLHEISSGAFFEFVHSCSRIHELYLSQNRRVNKSLFHKLLGLDRHFSVVSLDLSHSAPSSNAIDCRISIDKLILIGHTFDHTDLPLLEKISGLRSLHLSLTRFTASDLGILIQNPQMQSLQTIRVTEVSKARLSAIFKELSPTIRSLNCTCTMDENSLVLNKVVN